MTASASEFGRLTDALHDNYGADLINLASMRTVCMDLLRSYGREQGSNVKLLCETLADCIASHLHLARIAPAQVDAAAADLRRTNETLELLNSLPE